MCGDRSLMCRCRENGSTYSLLGIGVSNMRKFGLAVVGACLSASWAVAGDLVGDATKGKALYQACEACHSIDENDLGPKHRGVVGRAAGSISDYAYSAALKNSGLV